MKDNHVYRKLIVYNKSTDYVVHVYKLIKKFPKEEQYALCDQLRRAVVSISSNIAEGMGRVSTKEKIHFVEIAFGSLMEVESQLDVAKKLGYITTEELAITDEMSIELERLLSGLRTSLKNDNGEINDF